MHKLKNMQADVPGGSTFYVHQTEYTVFGDTLSALITKVIAHYNANGIPVPENLNDIIEDQICQRLQSQGAGTLCRDVDPVIVQQQNAERKKHKRCGAC